MGRPQPGAVIRITNHSSVQPVIVVTADADGKYTAVLDRPDTYTVFARVAAMRAAGVQIPVLHEGRNELDIVVTVPAPGGGGR